MSNNIVIFFESYGQIEQDFHVATRNNPGCPITIVIPGNQDLFKFFQVINERVFHDTINLIYLEPYQTRRAKAKGINKIFHLFPDIIRERRYLKEIFDKYFAELEGSEVFFRGRGYCEYRFYLLKKLSKRNRLVCINYGPPYMGKYTPASIVDLATLIILKLIYGRDIAMGKFPSEFPITKGFAYIPDKFMEKEVDSGIDWEKRNEMLKDFDSSQFRVFDVGNYSVIYFDENLTGRGYLNIDKDTYSRELTRIFDVLSKYFPEKEIARKYHPGYPSDKTIINIGDVLPDFIPAELLYNDNVKMYLTVTSYSIVNVEKGLAVSLTDLITFKDDKTKNQLKEILVQRAKSKILFPKSLDEFERILVSIV